VFSLGRGPARSFLVNDSEGNEIEIVSEGNEIEIVGESP
jgi:hypothetical protein